MTDAGLKPRRIKRVAVLGGGLMGSGIATASVLAGVEVLLKEINDKFLQARRRPALCPGLLHLGLWSLGRENAQGRLHCMHRRERVSGTGARAFVISGMPGSRSVKFQL